MTKNVVIVSNGAPDNPRGAWSAAGSSWTTENMPTFSNGSGSGWSSIAYSPSLDLFVAVANGGSNNNNALATSTDGQVWTGRAIPQANAWNGVCWAGGTINLFVAVASSGTNRVMTSPDGTNWTVRTAASVSGWNAVAYSADLDLLCAVGDTNTIMTSSDGINWSSQTGPATSKNWVSVVWAAGAIQKFVAVAGGAGGSNDEMYSSLGTSWTQQTVGPGSGYSWARIGYSPTLDMLIVIGGNTGVYNRSTNATSWTETATGVGSNPFHGIDYSIDLGLWVMVGTGSIYTSSTGTSWTSQTTPSGSWNAVAAGLTSAPTEIDIPASTHALGVSMAAVVIGSAPRKPPVIITIM